MRGLIMWCVGQGDKQVGRKCVKELRCGYRMRGLSTCGYKERKGENIVGKS